MGCENVSYTESSAPEDDSKNIYETLDEELPNLEQSGVDIKKQSFTIVTDKKAVFYNEESASGSISKAVEKRNTFLFDKYGAELRVNEVTASDLTSALKAALESGLTYCDMISVSAKETVKLFTAGLLGDMNKLPDFSLENVYFDTENAQNLATNNSLYLLADPTAQIYEETYVMFFNRDLVETKAGMSPETLVMQGKWTWDSFNEVARAAAPDVYNKSTADLTIDTFGFAAYYNEDTMPIVMWTGTGYETVSNTHKNPVSLTMSIDEVKTVATLLKKAYDQKGRYPLEGDDAATVFKSGRMAFFVNKFNYFYSLRNEDSGYNFGFLPIPKLNEEQNGYHCLVSSDARVISIPKFIENAPEERQRFISAVISATCAAGRQTVKTAFINDHIGLYLTDNEETVMLQTICESATFDFAAVYGSAISEIRRPTTTAICDYIEFGSALSTSIGRNVAAFEKYCAEKFK